jgi:hypothetical protein
MPIAARRTIAIMASSLLMIGLASCGKTPEQAPAGSALPTRAEIDSLKGEGLKQAAREASKFELWAHYRLMQATGMDQALGGDARHSSARRSPRRPTCRA